MSSQNEHVRAQARARLERQTPIADDARLLPWQQRPLLLSATRNAETRQVNASRRC
jgi:hypothetical protein